ncbi:hypothetical protein Patl1_11831 [Pistacia atlantica]|uniref:Uncharacterized protein n=1 Tax=Pistacia atlantica TaxID=434234 RepID=A0ACC1A0X9_9ROSI|nr:hypothetical protein Patl1_11831 [Pistacia atlantica]
MASAQIKLPHNFDAILKRADSKVDKSSDKLKNHLVGGISMDNQKMRFLADCETSKNTFWIYARGMDITSGDDKNCWNWTFMKDDDVNAHVQVAELLGVTDLSLKAQFETELLSPNTHYEVAFVLMMKKKSEGFDQGHQVTLSLVIPDGSEQTRKEDLSKMTKNEWKQIRIGAFKTSDDMEGSMEISLSESGSQTKKGLVVQKIVIRPIVK